MYRNRLPVFVGGRRKSACRSRAASCLGRVSVDEEEEEEDGEGGGGGAGGSWSYMALCSAGFASLFPWRRLSYSAPPWDGLCM